jgi:hypothetical protein
MTEYYDDLGDRGRLRPGGGRPGDDGIVSSSAIAL